MSDDEEAEPSKKTEVVETPGIDTVEVKKQAQQQKIDQLEKEKVAEAEKRREHDRERERLKQKAAEDEQRIQEELEEQMEAEKEEDRRREREREVEQAKFEAKEREKEKRLEEEREKMKEQEQERQRQRELEKIQKLKERERIKSEKEKEAAKEREKQMEKVRKEQDEKRERERIREEKEKQKQEREKQRKIESEAREKEREKLREEERQRQMEYEREREAEAEREREEWEAAREAERKRQQAELEAQLRSEVDESEPVGEIDFRGHIEDPNFVRHNLDRLESFREGGLQKLPPPPESSLSRIFYKAGPLGPTHRKKPRIETIKLSWVTRQILSERENFELKIEYELKELALFLIYIILLAIIGYGMITPSMGHLNIAVKHALISRRFTSDGVDITFSQIHKPIHVFDFLEQVWMHVVYREYWYIRGFKEIEVSDEDVGMLLDNKILGMPYIHMVRSGTRNCRIHTLFSPLYSECYDFYTPKSQQKKDFVGHDEIIWKFSSGNEYEVSYPGRISTYEPGGFYQNLDDNREDFFLQLQSIKNNLWITRATRALIINLNVYNANVNLFCVIRIAFEIPPTGGVFPSFSFKTVKLTRYLSIKDYFIMGCEIVFFLFTLFYVAEELREAFHFGASYFLQFWCLIDLVAVILAFILSCLILNRMATMTSQVYSMVTTEFYTANFQKIAALQSATNVVLALTTFFMWIKLLRFLNLSRAVHLLGKTMSACAYELMNFFVIFGIIFYSFAILTHSWFGRQVYEYASVGGSMVTLSRILLGNLDYSIISRVDPILAGLFIVSFVFINLYLLLNMFVAIMCFSYGEVKDDGEYNPKQLTTVNYLMRSVYNVLPFLKEKPRLKMTAKYAQEKNAITYDEIIGVLKNYNFTVDEIRMFLAKYKIREFTITSRWDIQRIVRDMERRGFIPIKPNDEGMTMEEMMEATMVREDLRGEDNPAYDLTIKEYELLQARLDQIEIQFEIMAERLNVINKRTLS